jgi:hypothetical protein
MGSPRSPETPRDRQVGRTTPVAAASSPIATAERAYRKAAKKTGVAPSTIPNRITGYADPQIRPTTRRRSRFRRSVSDSTTYLPRAISAPQESVVARA